MSIHSKAWNGLNVIVYGSTPLIPSRIEQALASSSPAMEVNIFAFEKFDDAHAFAKQRKDCGLLFCLDQTENRPFSDVVNELLIPYESRGLPGFAFGLYGKEQSFTGLRAFASNRRILDYLSYEELLDKKFALNFANSAWLKYSQAFSSKMLSEQMQETVLSIYETKYGEQARVAYSRVTEYIASKLNLSWIDYFALNWASPLANAYLQSPEILKTQPALTQICDIENFRSLGGSSFAELQKLAGPLWLRTAVTIQKIIQSVNDNTIDQTLGEISSLAKPGGFALYRVIKSGVDDLKTIINGELVQMKDAA